MTKLPSPNGQPVHIGEKIRTILATDLPTAEKLLLIAIADHGGKDGVSFPSQATLAKELTFTDRGVRKLIAGLKENGILTTAKRPGGNRVQYGIRWASLPTPHAKNAEVTGTPVPDTAPENQAVTGTPVPDTFCSEPGTQFRSNRNPSSGVTGTPVPTNGKGTGTLTNTGCDDRRFRRWCSSLDSQEFQSPDQGLERFSEALKSGFVRESQRINFIALWINTANKAKARKIGNAAAVFVKNLKDALATRSWKIGTDADDDAAREFLRKHDRRDADDFSPETQAVADAIADDIPFEEYADEPVC